MTEHTTYKERLAETSQEQRDLYGHWHALRLLQIDGITRPEPGLENRLKEEMGKGNVGMRRTWFGFGPERYELTGTGDAVVRSEQRKLQSTEQELRSLYNGEQEEVIKRHGFEPLDYEVERAILAHGAGDGREYGCFKAMDRSLLKVLAQYKRNDDLDREAARAALRRRAERAVAPARRRESGAERSTYDSGSAYDGGLWPIASSSPVAETYHDTPHFEPGGGSFGGAGATGSWDPSPSYSHTTHDSGYSHYDSGSSGGWDSGGFDGGGCDGGGGGD